MSDAGAGLVEIRCAGTYGAAPCDRILMDAPAAWGPPEVRVITARVGASGRGIVKRCPNCKSWVDVLFRVAQVA